MNAFFTLINRLKVETESALLKKKPRIRFNIKLFSHIYETNYFLDNGMFLEATRLVGEVQGYLDENRLLLKDEQYIALQFNSAVAYFGNGQFSDSLKHVNNILNEFISGEVRLDLISSSRLLSIILHYELNNIEILESQVKSTYRFLMKKNLVFKSEKLVIEFIRKLSRIDNNDELMEALTTLRNSLLPLKSIPQEWEVLKAFYILDWLEGKMLGKSTSWVINERINRAESN